MSIIYDLYDLKHHMTQVAAAMRAITDDTGRHQVHADELDGAAAICLEWIAELEEP